MTDFIRINAPRAQKAAEIVALIHKSAASQRASEDDVLGLLGTVRNALGGVKIEEADKPEEEAAKEKPAPLTPIAESLHYLRISAFVAAIPRSHLSSYGTHIMSRMSEEFNTHVP